MIGRRQLPDDFARWNRRWNAPYGRLCRRRVPPMWARLRAPKLFGPFAFQPDNSETRRFEYPWVFDAVAPVRGMRALEIGGSLAGMQFVLARHGVEVVNVDPGERAARGWPVTPDLIARLNRAFGTGVELHPCFLAEADLDSESFDVVYSISTIEHIPTESLPALVQEVGRLLRPGGRFVLTIDLFLDLAPFGYAKENPSGTNVDVRWLVEESGLVLEQGDPEELLGFPEFDPRRVLDNLMHYEYGAYIPSVAQALVLSKPLSP